MVNDTVVENPGRVPGPSFAGMNEDLADCAAAKGRESANACTRVMDSGRLPRDEFYIGYFNRGAGYRKAGDLDAADLDDLRSGHAGPANLEGLSLGRLNATDLNADHPA